MKCAGLVFTLMLAAPAWADAPGDWRTGTIVEQHTRWTSDGSALITESTLRGEFGTITMRQLGGSKDGIGMAVWHGLAVPRLGDAVTARIGAQRSVLDLRAGLLRSGQNARELPRMEFTRTTNTTGGQLFWESGCAILEFDADGTDDIAGTEEFAVMESSVAEWQQATGSCGYLDLIVPQERERLEVGFDRRNVIKFRDTRWCRPAMGDEPEVCYRDAAGGLTTLFFVDDASSGRNGAILDADIELNGVNFGISVGGVTEGSTGCLSDLANTLTHEIGHFIGLDHTCYDGTGTRPIDDAGNPLPDCGGMLSVEITEATMFNFQDCGETKKGTVEPDDVSGFCAIYPLADDPGVCEPAGGGGGGGCCQVGAGSQPPVGATLLSLVGLAIVLRRRRRA